MLPRPTRRQLLKLLSASVAIGALPTLTGCSGDETDSGGASGGGPFEYPKFDPDKPWWLQHNYGPVDGEAEETDLEVEGTIPPELTGLYLRNGSNPHTGESSHWFVGDGMVHGVTLVKGKPKWYRRRYIETPVLKTDSGLGVPSLTDHTANVSVIHHGDRILASGEIGLPYEIDTDLKTVGTHDYAGALATAMTAHPKIDPVTGEMLMFGYGFTPPYLTFHVVDAKGNLTKSEEITVKGPSMMHDFSITENYVIFMDLPITFDIDLVGQGKAFPYAWEDGYGARLGVMPRDGTNADVVWMEISDCYIFHTLNAYEEGDKIILEAARNEKLWAGGADSFDGRPYLYRFEIDLIKKSVKESQVEEMPVEFPQLDRRTIGRKQRYGYAAAIQRDQGPNSIPAAVGLMKFDRQKDTSKLHELPAGQQPDEPFFVPASKDAGEDEGWLLSYVYDHRTEKSDLVIFDASNIAADPVGRVKLPYRVPFGFHGVWVPA